MAISTTGFVRPIILTTSGGVELPVDATNGVSVTLATKIAGEDLTNGWLDVQRVSTQFLKLPAATLFSTTTVDASSSLTGEWMTIDGLTRWTLWFKMNQTYTVTVYMRPAAATGLTDAVHGYTGTANEVVYLTNWHSTSNLGAFADQIRIDCSNTSGSSGTLAAYLFVAP